MKNKLRFLSRVLVVISRDMFIGLILGISAAVLFGGISPGTAGVVGLLIPAGAAAGVFKGLAKFISLNIASALPSKGYRFEYPKFKILLLWLGVLTASLIFAYGLNIISWFKGPFELLTDNVLFRDVPHNIWLTGIIIATAIGLAAHVYEPPYNEDECLANDDEDEGLDSHEEQPVRENNLS